MRFFRSSALVWTANLAYLSVSALGGLLHDHSHAHSHGRSHGPSPAEGRCHDAIALEERQSEPPGHEDDSSPAPVSDDDCLACRFIAQSACVSLPTPEPGLSPLVVELLIAAPTISLSPDHSSGLARAPPIG